VFLLTFLVLDRAHCHELVNLLVEEPRVNCLPFLAKRAPNYIHGLSLVGRIRRVRYSVGVGVLK
jgi:hypothetical protein